MAAAHGSSHARCLGNWRTEVLLEGNPIGAARLHELGDVNRLAKPGTVRDAALAWADDLGKISPNATARIKTLIGAASGQSLAEHLVAERDSFVASLHHGDALEGINAFLEKRPPVYK